MRQIEEMNKMNENRLFVLINSI